MIDGCGWSWSSDCRTRWRWARTMVGVLAAQPPEEFGKVMSRMPGPVPFLLFPFETLWVRARAGQLNIGDSAPDFNLSKVDKTAHIQLSALNQQQPVALIFGSYT